MLPLSRLGCPLSLKTPNMGNVGFHFHGQPQAAIAYLEIDPISAFLERVKNSQGSEEERQYKQPPAGLI